MLRDVSVTPQVTYFLALSRWTQFLKVRHFQAPPRLSRLFSTPHLKASEKAAASSRAAHVQSACSSDPSLRELFLYRMRLSTGLQQHRGDLGYELQLQQPKVCDSAIHLRVKLTAGKCY